MLNRKYSIPPREKEPQSLITCLVSIKDDMEASWNSWDEMAKEEAKSPHYIEAIMVIF